jgi:flagellar assembly protein FliH
MSERIIAKENLPILTAWKADSFDTPGGTSQRRKLPTAGEIEAIERRAYEEGYRSGIAEAQQEAKRIAGLLQTLSGAIEAMESDLAESVVTLAVELSRQMVRGALAVRPEVVLPVVREAIESLVESEQRNLLLVNARDADLVRRHLADELAKTGWTVVVDDGVEAGGCRIESAQGDVDATLAERWKQLLSTLGRDDAWLA